MCINHVYTQVQYNSKGRFFKPSRKNGILQKISNHSPHGMSLQMHSFENLKGLRFGSWYRQIRLFLPIL